MSPKTIAKAPAKSAKTYQMLIDGKLVSARSGATREIRDPGNGELLALVPESSRDDAKLAIAAARKAFDEGQWRKTTAQDRGKLLLKIGDLIRANAKTFDLDFVSHEPHKRIETALAEIGFARTTGRHFDHPDCKYYAEFVSPPVAIGEEVIKKLKRLATPFGFLTLLTPTDCVKDRLAAYLHWKDTQALEQALLVALGNRIEMSRVKAWAAKEGGKAAFERFAAELTSRRKRKVQIGKAGKRGSK